MLIVDGLVLKLAEHLACLLVGVGVYDQSIFEKCLWIVRC
jgi:hypothetical protein